MKMSKIMIGPKYCLILMLSSVVVVASDSPQFTPRATMGDSTVEPVWEQRLTVTVSAANADINGASEKAIQAAVDYIARFGGGTVKLLPGTYRLRNAVYLQSKVRLVGSGATTLLVKEPSVTSGLGQDSDWFDQEITLADPTGFELGDGICLTTKDIGEGPQTVKRTLVARTGNRFKLDDGQRYDFWRLGDTKVSTLFPLLSGENIADVDIENLVLDGNRDKNGYLDGNFAGCIFLQQCSRVTIRGVVARNYNGDGISWQVCHDLMVENCVSEGNAGSGMHDGSGSQRSIIRNNRLTGNETGIYFCWGVRNAVAEGNIIAGNRIGISIGHHDTDDSIRNNEITGNKAVGFLFRPERGPDFAARRILVERNRFVNNGGPKGFVLAILGGTESVVIADNEIRDETRHLTESGAILVEPQAKNITIKNNKLTP